MAAFFKERNYKRRTVSASNYAQQENKKKKSVELSGWEAPEPIKETQSKCWSCDDAEKIIPKLLLGQIQLELYFLFKGLLQDGKTNIQKKINGQSRCRV